MVLIEMRESSYNKALDLVEEAMSNTKKTKMALCDLHDCLEECYSDAEEDYDEYGDSNYAMIDNVEVGEINYRGNMRRGMRHWDDEHYDMDSRTRNGMRRAMRSRRSRPGRYAY